MRTSFYEIDQAAYLYPRVSVSESERKQREEPVRQWCAYELIRAYGFRIDELTFERQVRVGSKTYRIDILVLRRGRPWIVVECKERDYRKGQAALGQAISYASASEIQADYVIYTNGQEWQVRRKLSGAWVEVSDIPLTTDSLTDQPLAELLRTLDDAAPLLCKLDCDLVGVEAHVFLSAMQRLFHASSLLTQDIDENLRYAIDNVLRIIATPGFDHGYHSEKLGAAVHALDRFRAEAKLGPEIGPIGRVKNIGTELRLLSAETMSMLEQADHPIPANKAALRVLAALLEYGQNLPVKASDFCRIEANLHQALREWFTYAFARHFHVRLPDTLDAIWWDDIRSYCNPAWRKAQEGERDPSPEKILLLWLADKIFFWRRFRRWRGKDMIEP